jgi:ABC-type polysaccharide/polyol phosphate transport system ATPase subunit
MTDIAIRVDGLSKQYRIGGPQERYKTLRDTLTDAMYAPFRRIRSTFQQLALSEAKGSNVQTLERSNVIWALKDVSFEVKPGEVVGIIGRNGAGKTTLLKILSRITEPTEGYAEIHGRVGSLLEVGTGFHPELTGRENIYLNGAILGMKKAEIERKFDEIVAFAEIEKFMDTPVKRYSSGMYVRLAFAVAAHLEPEILLVDEVLAVGDVAFQKKCLGKMGGVAKEGRTVLFVSHNMGAIVSLCRKALLLEDGRIKLQGESSEVTQFYLLSCSASSSNEKRAIDLSRLPRSQSNLGQKVRFLEIELTNESGEVTYSFGLYEKMHITLLIESNVHCKDFIVGFSVRTLGDAILYTSASDDKGSFLCIRPGVFRVKCTISPNYLRPGYYSLQIGAVVGVTQDLLEDAARFEIIATRHYSKTSMYNLPGYLHFDYEWSIQEVT